MKITAVTLALLTVMASAALAQEDTLVDVDIGPGNFAPDVYLSARAVDIGLDVDGTGSSINPTDLRPGNYAFMGERIIYVVVVRDQNGAQDIQLVKWVHEGGDEMGPCTDVTSAVRGEGSQAAYCMATNKKTLAENGVVNGTVTGGGWVKCPKDTEKIEIDTSANLQWDNQTDRLYKCVLTVEDWSGSEIQVVAEDTSGVDTGETLAEDWNFNPPLVVDIDTSDTGPLTFGDPVLDQDVPFATSPNCVIDVDSEDLTSRDCTKYVPTNFDEPEKKCDVSFSENKLIIENMGETNLWAFIASENFYASDTMAKCPFTNELHANQFEYRATSGSFDSGWRVMPQYSPSLGCAGVTLLGQCRGGCRIPVGIPFDILSPGMTIEVAMKLVWPTPCIGDFDTGTIHAIVRAI